MECFMGMSMMKQVVNDKEAYMIQQGQRIDIEGEDYQDMKKGAVPFDELNLINNADIKLTGIECLNGTEAYAVKNDDTTLYFDIKTGYKIAEAKEMEQMGQKTTQTTYYGDYKDVKGIKVPYKVNMNVGVELDMTVSEVKINEGVSAADFQ